MKWLLPALNPAFSPGEKERHSHVFWFCGWLSGKSSHRSFNNAANGSPSRWREGRVKGKRQKPISFQLGF
jgi:hypothetical protein